MQSNVRSVCVYCGSRVGTNSSYADAAERLGDAIGKAGLDLVYGAGSVGLMGITARSARAAGGRVIGIIPDHLDDVEITQDGLSDTIVTKSMHERKKLMFDKSDAFIVMPGGLGTLDETFEIMTWAQLSLHKRPIIIVNQDGYWDPFIALVDHVVAHGFASQQHAALLKTVDTPEEAVASLLTTPISQTPAKTDLF